MDPFEQRHLERVPGLRRQLHVGFGLRDQVERAQQVFAREPRHQPLQPLAIGFKHHLGIGQALRVDGDQRHRAHQARQLAAEDAKVVAGFDGPAGQRKGGRRVFVGDRRQDVEQQVAAHQAEHRGDIVGGDGGAGKRQHLIEGALRVAHAAFGIARQNRQRVVGNRDGLGIGDVAQLAGNGGGGDGAELVDLRARLDRVGDLVQLGRRHDEDDVRRRLLHRLEQRVERVVRQLVDFVDDEDLVAVARRRDGEVADDDLAHVVDAGVAGRVDLEHVEVAALRDLDAGVALPARDRAWGR